MPLGEGWQRGGPVPVEGCTLQDRPCDASPQHPKPALCWMHLSRISLCQPNPMASEVILGIRPLNDTSRAGCSQGKQDLPGTQQM